MPSLSDYLAKNYLTASSSTNADPLDTRPSKKRKKNKTSIVEATNTLLIADDDDGLLLSSKSRRDGEDAENEGPLMFDTKVRSAEFRKSKKNAWQTLSNGDAARPSTKSQNENNDNDDDADKLLRQTIATNDRSKADLEAENAPTIVETEDTGPRMESGVRAGIQTAADTARLIAEQEAREAAEEESQRTKSRKKKKSASDQPEPAEETIYRDATGRRIDLTLRRQEARKAELERIAAEKKARDQALGDVQLRQREERKQELEDAKFLTLARGADDEEMNTRMKEEVRWNDPMAAYMANKREEEEESSSAAALTKTKHRGSRNVQQTTKARKKEYTGAAPPNRYGIKPGWRWDGVDRGNGFEKDWFQARGRKARNESLEYQWQMDE